MKSGLWDQKFYLKSCKIRLSLWIDCKNRVAFLSLVEWDEFGQNPKKQLFNWDFFGGGVEVGFHLELEEKLKTAHQISMPFLQCIESYWSNGKYQMALPNSYSLSALSCQLIVCHFWILIIFNRLKKGLRIPQFLSEDRKEMSSRCLGWTDRIKG